jgi:hypothetical protein
MRGNRAPIMRSFSFLQSDRDVVGGTQKHQNRLGFVVVRSASERPTITKKKKPRKPPVDSINAVSTDKLPVVERSEPKGHF